MKVIATKEGAWTLTDGYSFVKKSHGDLAFDREMQKDQPRAADAARTLVGRHLHFALPAQRTLHALAGQWSGTALQRCPRNYEPK